MSLVLNANLRMARCLRAVYASFDVTTFGGRSSPFPGGRTSRRSTRVIYTVWGTCGTNSCQIQQSVGSLFDLFLLLLIFFGNSFPGGQFYSHSAVFGVAMIPSDVTVHLIHFTVPLVVTHVIVGEFLFHVVLIFISILESFVHWRVGGPWIFVRCGTIRVIFAGVGGKNYVF